MTAFCTACRLWHPGPCIPPCPCGARHESPRTVDHDGGMRPVDNTQVLADQAAFIAGRGGP